MLELHLKYKVFHIKAVRIENSNILLTKHEIKQHNRRSTQIKTYSWDNAQVTLAGNKCDMEEERVVSTEKGKQLAEQLGQF